MAIDFSIEEPGEDFGTLVIEVGAVGEDAGIFFSDGRLTIRVPLYVGQAKELVEVVNQVATLPDPDEEVA